MKFGGDTDDTTTFVTVAGDIDDVTPVTARDLVVFVFTELTQAALDSCSFDEFSDGELAVVSGGSGAFTIGNIEGGDLTVVFLLDNAGDQADGQIDSGDPIAVLADPDGDLRGVRPQLQVTVEQIDITFSSAGADACPPGLPGQSGDPGNADAFRITKTSAP